MPSAVTERQSSTSTSSSPAKGAVLGPDVQDELLHARIAPVGCTVQGAVPLVVPAVPLHFDEDLEFFAVAADFALPRPLQRSAGGEEEEEGGEKGVVHGDTRVRV